jgi:hypothetical protein
MLPAITTASARGGQLPDLRVVRGFFPYALSARRPTRALRAFHIAIFNRYGLTFIPMSLRSWQNLRSQPTRQAASAQRETDRQAVGINHRINLAG